MKKRIIIGILVLMLMLAGTALAGVNRNVGREVLESEGIRASVLMDDTLYVMGYNSLYAIKPETETEFTKYAMDPMYTDDGVNGNIVCCFAYDGSVMMLVDWMQYIDDGYEYLGRQLMRMEIGDPVTMTSVLDVDMTDLTEDYGYGDYPCYVNQTVCSGSHLVMNTYTSYGDMMLYDLDLNTGYGVFLDCSNVYSMFEYRDNTVLVFTNDYSEDGIHVFCYDPENELLTETDEYNLTQERLYAIGGINGPVYRPETDTILFCENGSLWETTGPNFDNAREITELSMMYGGDICAGLCGDCYFNVAYDVIYVRSINPEDVPEVIMKVTDASYSSAVVATAEKFSMPGQSIAVAVSRNYTGEEIVNAMLSRDDTVDIYILPCDTQEFKSLHERGYMLDLSGNETLRKMGESVYPGFQKIMWRGNELVCIPVSLYGWQMGYSPEAMEKIGLTEEDVPENWGEFLDFLEALPEKIEDRNDVIVVDTYTSKTYFLQELMLAAMRDYTYQRLANGQESGYNSPELLEILERIQNLNLDALGISDGDAEDYEQEYVYYGSEGTLLQTSVSGVLGNRYDNYQVILLGIGNNDLGSINMYASMAFVNPFTRYPEAAIQFLAELSGNLEADVAYNLSDERNEPLRYEWYEENLKSYDEQIQSLKEYLEQADEADKPLIEEEIQTWEAYRESYANEWRISPEDIELYRSRADRIQILGYEYLDLLYTGEEFYEQLEGFTSGSLSARDYLAWVDSKIRMAMLEGN